MFIPQPLKKIASPLTLIWVLGLFTPIVCLLWFMLHAIDNERIGIKNRLDQLHKYNAQQAVQAWEAQWRQSTDNALKEITGLTPALQFQQATTKWNFDSAIIYTENTIKYPTLESPNPPALHNTPTLEKAKRLDFVEKNKRLARDAYIQASQASNDRTEVLQLLVLAARSEYQAGSIALAYNSYRDLRFKLEAESATQQYNNNDLLTVLPAVIRAIEIALKHDDIHDNKALLVEDLHWLTDRLNNYSDAQLPSRRRSFLMSKTQDLADALKQPISFHTFNAEVLSYALLTHPNGIPSWFETPQQQTLVQIAAASADVKLFVTLENLTKSLQRHLDSHFQENTAIAQINRMATQQNQDLIFQTQTITLSTEAFVAIHWASTTDYQDTFSKRQTTYIAMATSVIAFLCFCAIFTLRYLQRQNRLSELKNDAISTIAHELKTPLTSIRLLLDNLIANPRNIDKNTQEYVTIISQEHDRLSSLVDNFLTFSRFENNQFRLNEELLDINDLVKECCQLSHERIQKQSVTLTLDLTHQPLPFYGDKSLLLTIFINLIDNACKYSVAPKKITLTTQLSKNTMYLAVTDNGIGLSSNDQKHVFDQYFRVEQKLSRTTEGSGLGLHIAQKIALAHKGKITVTSRLNTGSTFTLCLKRDNLPTDNPQKNHYET